VVVNLSSQSVTVSHASVYFPCIYHDWF